MTNVTLVYGGSSAERERAIAAQRSAGGKAVAIIEGLAGAALADSALDSTPDLTIVRIAPGCPCCTGKLTMRVTLNRLLREHPEEVYISLANNEHLLGVINFLNEDQYRERLEVTGSVDCSISGTGSTNTGY